MFNFEIEWRDGRGRRGTVWVIESSEVNARFHFEQLFPNRVIMRIDVYKVAA